jgi:hypothetical protein
MSSFKDYDGFEFNKFVNFGYALPKEPELDLVELIDKLSKNNMIFETSFKHRKKNKMGFIVAQDKEQAEYIAKIRGFKEKVKGTVTFFYNPGEEESV